MQISAYLFRLVLFTNYIEKQRMIRKNYWFNVTNQLRKFHSDINYIYFLIHLKCFLKFPYIKQKFVIQNVVIQTHNAHFFSVDH